VKHAAEEKSVDEIIAEAATEKMSAAIGGSEDDDVVGPPLPPGYQVGVYFHWVVGSCRYL